MRMARKPHFTGSKTMYQRIVNVKLICGCDIPLRSVLLASLSINAVKINITTHSLAGVTLVHGHSCVFRENDV